MEETNARHVESLPEKIDFVTVDASFISLKILLPVIKKWFDLFPSFDGAQDKLSSLGEGKRKEERSIVALIKPQFEAGKKDVSRGDGVIRDPEIHRLVLLDILSFAQKEGFGLLGLIKSPLLGPKGNTEFLVWLDLNGGGKSVEELVNEVVPLQ
jgi:23S rRNA (cytidine1920-2'-O)/16S rRNA (cytidine1409-2'-O)-methyltransferase